MPPPSPFAVRTAFSPAALSPLSQSLLLLLLAIAILLPGIWESTGLTGKDEFFLGLRTPMEMIEGDHWLVPFLDGAPRIRKPPLLYWLGRGAYEWLGISLFTARLLAVLFAGLFVVATAGIARRLSGLSETGWMAGCILLGCLGMASEARRFMLDVPVAALSASAFWAFLIWRDSRRFYWLTVSTLLLAAAFLTKGPIAALVCGGGLLALLASRHLRLDELLRAWPQLLMHGLLWAALALPWFYVVRQLYPEAAQLVLHDELESRQFFNLSPGILLGLLNIALPWVFVFVAAAWRLRNLPGLPRLALFWFAATFLPFFFIKSFDRYLIGSLLPLALFIALTLPGLQARWPFRAGALLALLFGGGLSLLSARLGGEGAAWIVVPALYLGWAWWQRRNLTHTFAAPALFWLSLLWGVFPGLGINAVPAEVVALARQQAVAFYQGPQPAMLPILSGQAHRHYGQLDRHDLAELAATHTPIFVAADTLPAFQSTLTAAGYRSHELGSYATLASHGSGLRFARPGTTAADWRQALETGTPTPLQTRIHWFSVHPEAPNKEPQA